MKKYKPEYMGKVMPVDNPSKLTDFVQNKYDSFSKIYDNVKDKSENISDVKTVDKDSSDTSSLSIKVSTDEDTLNDIKANMKDPSVNVENDVFTAVSHNS